MSIRLGWVRESRKSEEGGWVVVGVGAQGTVTASGGGTAVRVEEGEGDGHAGVRFAEG